MISKRIEKIASFIAHDRVADIGTDHGYLPIFAIQSGLACYVVAADVNAGPLERARANAAAVGAERIAFRLGYGLDVLEPGEVGTIVISGMGGKLMVDILQAGRSVVAQVGQLLLSPHLDVPYVRRQVHALGFVIAAEDMIYDEGKYYNIMDVRAAATIAYDDEGDYSEEEYLLGRCLLRARPPVFVEYCEHMAEHYSRIAESITNALVLGESGAARLAQAKRLRDMYFRQTW
ncbi:MAG: class I SAM-dependent methyltransferase [Defluviitaleaceae bacterium]|nr:class I SAM-dependent methyltransferase [Defluviitaleaceae bacterium]